MGNDLTRMAAFRELCRNGFRTFTVFLRAYPHSVHRPTRTRSHLAQECGETLLAEIRGQSLSIFLVRKAAELHGEHAGR